MRQVWRLTIEGERLNWADGGGLGERAIGPPRECPARLGVSGRVEEQTACATPCAGRLSGAGRPQGRPLNERWSRCGALFPKWSQRIKTRQGPARRSTTPQSLSGAGEPA
jgi:hypothetical protein